MVQLSFTATYIINKIKFLRFVLGISAEQLSANISMSDSYISSVESMANKSQYPHAILIKIADVLGCTVRDFYPPDEILLENDGEYITKTIISLSNLEDVKKVLTGLIDDGYFSKSRAFEDITKYLHINGKPESTVVKKGLEWTIENGLLTMNDGKFIAG
ncbi:helix-turn-helix domain-containing protein [Sphingobacterium sp. UDSM-2020]|uniref:helix-turn-helix domain-containing protein n=1 Tax=Sphingobacterium sp. UDSM-2020 TaxID=2795738 RepID=UPI001937BD26|nr:helix-turn-helix transcriptional regulator [Sphingobacterium sp. UDSM-2020]QQD11626.1 helix-turn-helix transcriptional regulator [Sphingobacterium sp. UDSM-2020]